jgi:hypothetical protein
MAVIPPGFVSALAILPARNAGVAVFTNAETGFASALRNSVLDRPMGASDKDWIADQRERGRQQGQSEGASRGAQVKAPGPSPALPLDAYRSYRDPWYGDIVIGRAARALTINFIRSPGMQEPLEPWSGETFRTRFADGCLEDALVTFISSGGRAQSITMAAASPEADFSYITRTCGSRGSSL